MAEHDELSAYLLGQLTPAESAAFEAHLRDCDTCRGELVELESLPGLLAGAAPAYAVPRDLEARTFAAIERTNGAGRRSRPPRRRAWWRRPPLLAGAVAALAAAAVAIVIVAGGGGPDGERIRLAGGDADVVADVVTTGVGREVTLTIRRLEDPRPDGLYELWFVAPDDTRRRPHRVSAGTFHPDDSGRGTVRLVGAAAAEQYPRISVTLEPSDGNPRRTGPEVLRGSP
jgi:anti-sigma-K factor RskA